jgi:predicted oxidoreductase
VAGEHNVSRTSIAYAWVLAHPARPMPLVGTQNVARILETKDVATIQMTRTQWYQILVAARGAPMP